jgi:uncharacterized repeat protein (TIGR04076 family)
MSNIIKVTVKSQKGKCAFEHKVSDMTIFDGKSVKGDICFSATNKIFIKDFGYANKES